MGSGRANSALPRKREQKLLALLHQARQKEGNQAAFVDLESSVRLGGKGVMNGEAMKHLRANSHLYAETATGAAKALLRKKGDPDHISTQRDDRDLQKWQQMI